MAVELLAIIIRENSKIKGIEIDGCILKIIQLADDTTCFDIDILSITDLLVMFKCFRLCAGLTINTDKTKANYIGSLKGWAEVPLGLDWTDPYINCLCITLSGNEDVHYELNYKKRILNLENVLRLRRSPTNAWYPVWSGTCISNSFKAIYGHCSHIWYYHLA